MICIYHSKDLDGISSAAIVSKKFNGVELVGYDYGDQLPIIKSDVPLIVVDVSFPMDVMLKMSMDRGMDLMWIDHHIKSIKEYEQFMKGRKDAFCVTHVEDGTAACELTWKALFPDVEIPMGIRLLGMYDVGRNDDPIRWNNEVLPFQYGMRTICSSPEEFPHEILGSDDIASKLVMELTEKGKAILQYVRKTDVSGLKRLSFESNVLGYRALCFNASSYNFLSFASQWDPSKYDVAVGLSFDGKQWRCSIYTDKDDIDCNEIAHRLGGGGHRKAAGFVVNSLDDIRG